jgi:hypothetical protein
VSGYRRCSDCGAGSHWRPLTSIATLGHGGAPATARTPAAVPRQLGPQPEPAPPPRLRAAYPHQYRALYASPAPGKSPCDRKGGMPPAHRPTTPPVPLKGAEPSCPPRPCGRSIWATALGPSAAEPAGSPTAVPSLKLTCCSTATCASRSSRCSRPDDHQHYQADRAQLRAAPVVSAGDRDPYTALLRLRRRSPRRPVPPPDQARVGEPVRMRNPEIQPWTDAPPRHPPVSRQGR